MKLKINDRIEMKFNGQDRAYECLVKQIYQYAVGDKVEKACELEMTYEDNGAYVGIGRYTVKELRHLEKAGVAVKINNYDE